MNWLELGAGGVGIPKVLALWYNVFMSEFDLRAFKLTTLSSQTVNGIVLPHCIQPRCDWPAAFRRENQAEISTLLSSLFSLLSTRFTLRNYPPMA